MVTKNTKVDEKLNYGEKQYRVIDNRIAKGKNKRKVLIWLNIVGIIIMALTYVLCMAGIALLVVKEQSFELDLLGIILYLGTMLISFGIFIVAHEYVHYLTYRICGGVAKDKLKFGVVFKSAMAYCISLEPNTVRASRLSLMMPFYVLVIPTMIASIIFHSGFIAFLAALFASGSAGDFWYMWTLRKDSKDKYIIEAMPNDDGYELGYLLLEKID